MKWNILKESFCLLGHKRRLFCDNNIIRTSNFIVFPRFYNFSLGVKNNDFIYRRYQVKQETNRHSHAT